jgi:CubicO group peptidase (beta-lactamase class C family)
MSGFTRRTVMTATGAVAVSGAAGMAEAASEYWPGADGAWETIAPAAAGFDPPALADAVAQGLADQSVGVIVLRGGRIAAESYAADWGPAKSFQLASAAKSVVSVLIGMAIDQGFIKGVEQSAADFIPEWRGTPKAAITLRHLLTMTSGLHFEDLAVRNIAGDQFALNAATPIDHPPGTHWAYATPMFHLLYHVVARAVGQPFETYAQRMLIGPLGMEHWSWLTSVGQSASGPVTNYYTALCSTRDLARFGLFALRGGRWQGRQLVSAAYMKAATSPSQELNPSYGYLWWENAKPGVNASGAEAGFRFEGSPPDTFGALGAGGQVAIETPSLDLVVVRQGRQPEDPKTITRLLASTVAALRR